MKEIWRDIPGYKGLYKVSNTGRVMSNHAYHKTRKNIIRKQNKNGNGYFHVALHKNRIRKTIVVHRLVLMAFRPVKNRLFALHLDNNKENNNLYNLVWGTQKENCEHQRTHGTMLFGSKKPLSKLKESDVLKIKKLILKNTQTKKIAEKFDISKEVIKRIKRGDAWKHVTI